MRRIHPWPVISPHNSPLTRKMFPFSDVSLSLIQSACVDWWLNHRQIKWTWCNTCERKTLFFLQRSSRNSSKKWDKVRASSCVHIGRVIDCEAAATGPVSLRFREKPRKGLNRNLQHPRNLSCGCQINCYTKLDVVFPKSLHFVIEMIHVLQQQSLLSCCI